MKKAKELGALEVSRIEKPGTHFVGGVAGLLLLVSESGSRSWVLRTAVAGKRRHMGLGAFPDVTLADARRRARELRLQVDEGHDPIEERRAAHAALLASQAKAMTFAQCCDAYLVAHGDGWKNPKHRQQWQNTLTTYAYPVIGSLDVALVDDTLVFKVLDPIWKEKNETASRLRGRIESVLAWATVRKFRHGDNPARWKNNLDKLLVAPSKIQEVEHHAALPFREIGQFMLDLVKMEGFGARALEFAILTACRSGEVRGAVWAELDMEQRTWTIPAARMKAEKEHRIPLSDAAMDLIRAMPQVGEFVFPGARPGRPLSDMTLTAALRRMGRGDLTAHGFRSTFRDWAGEISNHPREVIEHALAHQLKDKAEAAYAHGTLFDKRRRLMEDWSRYCGTVTTAGNVLPMRKTA